MCHLLPCKNLRKTKLAVLIIIRDYMPLHVAYACEYLAHFHKLLHILTKKTSDGAYFITIFTIF